MHHLKVTLLSRAKFYPPTITASNILERIAKGTFGLNFFLL